MNRVIVTRHPATINWIAEQLESEGVEAFVASDEVIFRVRGDIDAAFGRGGDVVDRVPVLTGNVTAADVQNKSVYGNLPIDLAACAARVYPVLFRGQLPRGVDYTAHDMERAGVHLGGPYTVRLATHERVEDDEACTQAVDDLRNIFGDEGLITAGLNGDSAALERILEAVRPIL